MRSVSLIVLVVLAPLARPADDAAEAELKKFQGTWQLISAKTDGKKMDKETAAKIRVVIAGAKHTVFLDGKAIAKEVAFALDPSRKPKEVTDTLPNGKQIKGIYELDGDTLKSCVAPVGKDRPKEFSGEEGTGNTLRVFERVKP
jgi:uncharacterized protein (TIGR03067 family)